MQCLRPYNSQDKKKIYVSTMYILALVTNITISGFILQSLNIAGRIN